MAGCIATLLQRFAWGESLSAESRGGGLQSNARLLPYLFQLGHCFLGFCDETDLQVGLPGPPTPYPNAMLFWCGMSWLIALAQRTGRTGANVAYKTYASYHAKRMSQA